ncbi:hypothetical protein V8E36_008344 [Tilletia maclaganii]
MRPPRSSRRAWSPPRPCPASKKALGDVGPVGASCVEMWVSHLFPDRFEIFERAGIWIASDRQEFGGGGGCFLNSKSRVERTRATVEEGPRSVLKTGPVETRAPRTLGVSPHAKPEPKQRRDSPHRRQPQTNPTLPNPPGRGRRRIGRGRRLGTAPGPSPSRAASDATATAGSSDGHLPARRIGREGEAWAGGGCGRRELGEADGLPDQEEWGAKLLLSAHHRMCLWELEIGKARDSPLVSRRRQ